MKIIHLIAAGLMVAGIGVSTEASAQGYRGDRYDHRGDRRDDRRDYRDHHRGYDRHRGYGWNNNRYRVRCHIEWRHHRRVRVCR